MYAMPWYRSAAGATTRARRTCERMVSGIAARRMVPATIRRGRDARLADAAGAGGADGVAVGSSPSVVPGPVAAAAVADGAVAAEVGPGAGDRPTAPRLQATMRRSIPCSHGNGTPSAAVGATRRMRYPAGCSSSATVPAV